MIKSENFIHISGWMVSELQLKGNELLVYAIIYGFCQDEETKYSGGLQYLADWTNSTKQGVIKNIKSLCEKGLIVKTEYEKNNVKFVEYHTTKFNGTVKQSLMGGKQSLTNNIYNNINNNIYKYSGTVIKLNEKDYNNWQERFDLLDLKYELDKRDIWLASQTNNKNWFISTQQYLLTVQRKKEKEKETQDKISQPWWRE